MLYISIIIFIWLKFSLLFYKLKIINHNLYIPIHISKFTRLKHNISMNNIYLNKRYYSSNNNVIKELDAQIEKDNNVILIENLEDNDLTLGEGRSSFPKRGKDNSYNENSKYNWEYKEIYTDMLNDRNIIITKYKKFKGVYMLYNKINNKYYIGSSSKNLSRRLSCYYYLSSLSDKRPISNSIIHYGHNNFIVFILEYYSLDEDINILEREQFYFNKLKPKLNILTIAGNNLGFKHSIETKKKISIIQSNRIVKDETRKLVSNLFKGENNPFYNKSHSIEFISRLSKERLGINNPMYGKPKSKEFIYHMYKDKTGINNPMFGKPKSEETLKKLRKCIYVYDETTYNLIMKYDSFLIAVKDLKMGKSTLRKYALSNKPYKGKIYSYKSLHLEK